MRAVSGYEEAQAAATFIGRHHAATPTIGVVLGSGLSAFVEQITSPVVIPYKTIPGFPVSAVPGHKGELVLGKIGEANVVVMSGRVHYYEGHSMQRVTFPIRVLRAMNIHTLVVTNAAGAINTSYKPGDFMMIADHLNMVGDSPLRGVNDDRFGTRFPDMSEAYATEGRVLMRRAAGELGIPVHEGIYCALAGPTYETPAEVRMLRVLGADAVGMSTVPEVIVARHGGLRVAGLSVITNSAAGVAEGVLSHDEVKAVAQRVQKPLCDLLARAVQLLA